MLFYSLVSHDRARHMEGLQVSTRPSREPTHKEKKSVYLSSTRALEPLLTMGVRSKLESWSRNKLATRRCLFNEVNTQNTRSMMKLHPIYTRALFTAFAPGRSHCSTKFKSWADAKKRTAFWPLPLKFPNWRVGGGRSLFKYTRCV